MMWSTSLLIQFTTSEVMARIHRLRTENTCCWALTIAFSSCMLEVPIAIIPASLASTPRPYSLDWRAIRVRLCAGCCVSNTPDISGPTGAERRNFFEQESHVQDCFEREDGNDVVKHVVDLNNGTHLSSTVVAEMLVQSNKS